VTDDRFIADVERNGEMFFKANEQRKPPEDQGVPLDERDMGSMNVIWNRSQVTAFRWVGWASDPMEPTGRFLNRVFDLFPRGSHVNLVLETEEVREAAKACADQRSVPGGARRRE
jgi:hypothetical protein